MAWLSAPGFAQPMTKALVADRIVKVENGVDEFRNYLERRGDNATTAASTAPAAQAPRHRHRIPEDDREGQEGRPGRCARRAEPIDQPAATQVRCDRHVD